MKINLDEYKNIRELVSGLFQFDPTQKFTQAALAVTDEELLFYDDNAPDEKESIHYIYHIKKRIKLDKVVVALDEKIKKNKYLKDMGRINFLVEEEDEEGDTDNVEVIFYYYLTDKGQAESFINELKSLNVKVKKRKVDLSYNKI